MISEFLASIGSGKNVAESPTAFVQRQRLVKSPAEIELMRRSCSIASTAINRTVRETHVGDTEHEIFARVDFYTRMDGASFMAYPPVVAAGRNATTIHYINNNQRIADGEMVLMDAGCEYGGYSSDITRTWPVNGQFSKEQRLLYEVVQRLQQDLIGE